MNSTASEDLALVQNLIDRHFEVWNERQADHWSGRFPGLYSEDVMVADHNGIVTGYDGMVRLLQKVHGANPGFSFTPQPASWNHGLGRVTWGYGPKEDPNRVRGEDIFTIGDGKLTSLRVFIDQH